MKFLQKKKKLTQENKFFLFSTINVKKGLKNKSINLFFLLLKYLKKKYMKNPLDLLTNGFSNLKLLVYIYKKKVGSKVVIIPAYWYKYKKLKRGFLIFFKSLKSSMKESIEFKICKEFDDVLLNKGKSIKMRNFQYILASDNFFNLRYVMHYGANKNKKKAVRTVKNNKIDLKKKKMKKNEIFKRFKTINFFENYKKFTSFSERKFYDVHTNTLKQNNEKKI